MTHSANPFRAFQDDEDAQQQLTRTQGITQQLERDILEFLSSKYTDNATLTVAEIMRFYGCPHERAQRVVRNLLKEKVLAPAGKDTFRVLI